MSEWKAKRFWTESQVVPAEDGFTVHLDARPIMTPSKSALIVPTQEMAQIIAAEWQAQEEIIKPDTMPATKTANSAIDKVRVQHAEVAKLLSAYGDADLLCYRAEGPSALVERQAAVWDPMLAWGAEALDVRLEPRVGVMHKPQSAEDLAKLSARTHALSDFELTAFHDLVSLSGSLILGFAATYDARPVDALWDISRLDEIWQAEQWGSDDEAEALAALKKEQFLHAKRMFDVSRRDDGRG
ncbi:ATP12 family chaperone protein [Sulfitobacter aestuariivivens]|uniref:ATPase n=1 Tax=Sulfitobacter aestuariivivens TaxID=2766981 RepID=A0A927DA78_9RHOB|nr:ATP12 family protein [Sulfitobacter aestuariivivens]MBD3666027.1 ATPase [Sulfitobacter aestuariivivens]